MLANIKRQLRSTKTRANNIMTQVNMAAPDGETVEERVVRLRQNELRLTRIITSFNEWTHKYAEFVEGIIDEEAAVDGENEMSQFFTNELINQGEIEAQEALDSTKAQLLEVMTPAVGQTAESVQPVARNKAKLPELELQVYNGDPTRWLEWFQNFANMIDRSEMPKTQKFAYLLRSLKGQALRCIQGIHPTNENYDDALRILKNRFGDETMIVGALNTKMMNLPKSGESIHDIRFTVEQAVVIIRQLDRKSVV